MREAVAVWLIISLLLELGTSVAFYFWLRKRTEVSPARYGFPGYLERRYLQWCRENSVDGRVIVGLRVALLVNLVIAAVIGIPLVFR